MEIDALSSAWQPYGPWLLAGVTALVAVFLLRRALSRRLAFPYQLRESLFTPAERHFLAYLIKAVDGDAMIFGKVRVADVIRPWDRLPGKRWHEAFHPISSKHFDYVLCDPDELSVLCVIELNDRSHDDPERQERDAFLRGACEAAGLPLIEIPARKRYVIKALRKEIEEYL
jgi:hypothetical protein